MRLIKVPSATACTNSDYEIEFEELLQVPERYCILSHTWGREEVQYADVQHRNAYKHLVGWSKIQGVVAVAAQNCFEYLWVDTCCIDKSSSAELSEAINSMWKWYQRATLCYVYLEDVKIGKLDVEMLIKQHKAQIVASRWFTRGWTLQELLAPYDISFYDRAWNYMGNKTNLGTILSKATGILPEYLEAPELVFQASVARRMSWAASRTTTRTEDIAYCLMGLFDVNMPMLYGEGSKAFIRLQEEIMKQTEDQTLFVWTSSWGATLCGMLADHPKRFKDRESFIPRDVSSKYPPPHMTSRGLQIALKLLPMWRNLDHINLGRDAPDFDDSLNTATLEVHPSVAIYLKRLSATSNTFMRLRPDLLVFPRPFELDSLLVTVCQRATTSREALPLWRSLRIVSSGLSTLPIKFMQTKLVNARIDSDADFTTRLNNGLEPTTVEFSLASPSRSILLLEVATTRPWIYTGTKTYIAISIHSRPSLPGWQYAATIVRGDADLTAVASDSQRRYVPGDKTSKLESNANTLWYCTLGAMLIKFERGLRSEDEKCTLFFVTAEAWMTDASVPHKDLAIKSQMIQCYQPQIYRPEN